MRHKAILLSALLIAGTASAQAQMVPTTEYLKHRIDHAAKGHCHLQRARNHQYHYQGRKSENMARTYIQENL